jgi:hypothetical protein
VSDFLPWFHGITGCSLLRSVSRGWLPCVGCIQRALPASSGGARPDVEAVRVAADAIGVQSQEAALRQAREVYEVLSVRVVPHELAEDAQLYPVLARALGATDPTGTMSRAHLEIAHQTGRLGRLLEQPADGPEPEDLLELRQLLYGLHAILRLHFAQEEESYLSLAESREPASEGSSPITGDPATVPPT